MVTIEHRTRRVREMRQGRMVLGRERRGRLVRTHMSGNRNQGRGKMGEQVKRCARRPWNTRTGQDAKRKLPRRHRRSYMMNGTALRLSVRHLHNRARARVRTWPDSPMRSNIEASIVSRRYALPRGTVAVGTRPPCIRATDSNVCLCRLGDALLHGST